MYGLAPSKPECLRLLITAVSLSCLSSQANIGENTPKEKRIYKYEIKQEQENTIFPINTKTPSKSNLPDLGKYSTFPKPPSLTSAKRKRQPKKGSPKARINIVAEAEQKSSSATNGWYFLWEVKFKSPIHLGARQIETSTLSLRADSPYSSRFGSLQIRSDLPAHLLWQQPKPAALSAYPTDLAELRQNSKPFLQNLLHTAYRSKWYLRWAIPPNKNQPKESHLGSYLQLGGIQARDGSPWQFLNRSKPFSSPKPGRINTAIPSGMLPGHYFASTKYTSEMGQNIGLSFDSPNFGVFALHRRGSRAESLQSGVMLNFERLTSKARLTAQNPTDFFDFPPQKIALNTAKSQPINLNSTNNINAQNLYRVQFAGLFSQNLTKAPSQSGWYLSHTQQTQNASFYAARAKERWGELLRYDRAVKQFYFQAQWKRLQTPRWTKRPESTRQNTHRKTRFELRTEQSSSVSPLDYWGIQQRYHFQFELPLYDKIFSSVSLAKTLVKSLVLRNYFFASYTDANWVDAQRRLASSRQAQFYRRRLLFQNQIGWHFQQKVPSASTTYDHILRWKASAKIARFLEPKVLSYLNFGLEYHWLWRKTEQRNQTWHLMLKTDFAQQQPTSSQLERQPFQIGPILWSRKLILGIGWKQNPPTRIPQKVKTQRMAQSQKYKMGKPATRLGWKLAIQSKENNLTAIFEMLQIGPKRKNLQGIVEFSLFFQFWRYGHYFRRTNTLRWWKLFALQLKLGANISFSEVPKQKSTIMAKLHLWAQLKAHLQLAKNWSFQFGFKLEEWKLKNHSPVSSFWEPATTAKFSIMLFLRYELYSSKAHKEQNQRAKELPNNETLHETPDPTKEFEDSFKNIFDS